MAGGEPVLTIALAHPEEKEIWGAIAAAIEPRTWERPSQWARRMIVLPGTQTAKPGPYNPDVWPWSADFLDSLYDDPSRKGILATKPSQRGYSTNAMVLALWMCVHTPGPILYLTTDQPKTREFCDEQFVPMVKASTVLEDLFDVDDGRGELKHHKPYKGGVVDFVSAGTESGVISTSRRVVMLDEYEASSRLFGRTGGDLWTTAIKRVETWRELGVVLAFGHPRYEGEDIDALVRDLSDQGRWVFDCPLEGCGRVVEPGSTRIDFRRITEGGDRDPDSAVFVCNQCAKEIPDNLRARATWPARMGGGGSGRFESPLEPDVARRREYLGRSVNGTADPYKTVRSMARALVVARSEEQLVSEYNKGFGETRKASRPVITLTQVAEAMKPRVGGGDIVVPGGPLGVKLFCSGADVQRSAEFPAFYVWGGAFAASGWLYVTHLQIVQGWAAYWEYLRTMRIVVEGEGVRGISLASIDAGRWTKFILDQQREPMGPGVALYSAADSRVIRRLPMKYVPHLNEEQPSAIAPDRKRLHPTRPELGPIEYWYLWRHAWVDRAIRRWMEGRVVVLCEEPEGFRAHLTANQLRPAPKQHGLEQLREEWYCPKELRDDWLQAGAYCEAGAALVLGLDTIHAVAGMPEETAVVMGDDDGGSGGLGLGGRFGRGGWGGS